MDRRERYPNLVVAVRALLHQDRADLWTAIPGIVQSFDPSRATVTVQPAIMAQFRQQNGADVDEKWADVKLPILVDCPVFFPGGGGYVLSFPLHAGDEGGVLFASRCIDAWWQSGGVQRQAEIRMHDLSDGMFIPGLFSVPLVPPSLSTSKVQLRNTAGDCSVSIDAARCITLVAPGGVNIEGDLGITGSANILGGVGIGGDLAITGGATAGADVVAGAGTADSVGLQSHVHMVQNPAGPALPTTAPVAGT